MHARQQLGVGREPAVERVACPRKQPRSELLLEHDDGRTEERTVRQKLEDEGGGNLIRDVGHTDVKKGELRAENIALDDLRGERQGWGSVRE